MVRAYNRSDKEIVSRLSVLETQHLAMGKALENVSETVSKVNERLEAEFNKIQSNVDHIQVRIENKIDSLANQFQAAQKTPWGTIGTWVGLMIVLLTTLYSVQGSARDELKVDFDKKYQVIEQRVHDLELKTHNAK